MFHVRALELALRLSKQETLSLFMEVQGNNRAVLGALGQVVLICKKVGGDQVYVELMAVHMSSRPEVGTR